MKAILIAYKLASLEQYHKVLINRALFGYTDNSNKGAYIYKRGGSIVKSPTYKTHKRRNYSSKKGWGQSYFSAT